MKKILLLNGPNLNLLGKREPHIYGDETLEEIVGQIVEAFPQVELTHFQSNIEGELIDAIQEVPQKDFDGLVINAGAYTHYSYAIHDALKFVSIPKIEVHLSHIFAREPWRHTSVISPACDGMISGLGKKGYFLAIQALL
ncbi:MAG: type II 3-dehydroquinate dehydratase [Bacteroidota bacterium]